MSVAAKGSRQKRGCSEKIPIARQLPLVLDSNEKYDLHNVIMTEVTFSFFDGRCCMFQEH